jgi:hypothetical protein
VVRVVDYEGHFDAAVCFCDAVEKGRDVAGTFYRGAETMVYCAKGSF